MSYDMVIYCSFQHMLMLLRQATCYIFVLTEDERTAVHTDSGLRTLEVTGAIISRRRRMKTCLRAMHLRKTHSRLFSYGNKLNTHRKGDNRKRSWQLTNADRKSIETVFSIPICRQIGDKWQSKTLFLTCFDLRLSIVLTFSIAAYPV